MIPQALVWSLPSSKMIATSNFAHNIAPASVSVISVVSMIVMWTMMTAAVPLTTALVTEIAAVMLPMIVSTAAADGRCCIIIPMQRMPLVQLMHVPPCIGAGLRQPSRHVADAALAVNADDRLREDVVGLLIASIAVLREQEHRLLGGLADAPINKATEPGSEEIVFRNALSIPKPN